ncbi:hypothetical protein PF003_g5943 [Phytophthora fragariae]|nr:hypothetical protein PF003_g5943 [Phytophthora fragariae]
MWVTVSSQSRQRLSQLSALVSNHFPNREETRSSHVLLARLLSRHVKLARLPSAANTSSSRPVPPPDTGGNQPGPSDRERASSDTTRLHAGSDELPASSGGGDMESKH